MPMILKNGRSWRGRYEELVNAFIIAEFAGAIIRLVLIITTKHLHIERAGPNPPKSTLFLWQDR
jgi:hypothetical protein